MGFLVSLDQITPADASRVGGKAYNCALLGQRGFPVPEGAAVVAEAMGSPAALAELDTWLSQLSAGVLVAVRSSAADEDSAGHSFAGIHESRLNVLRHLVPEAVRVCWSSVTPPSSVEKEAWVFVRRRNSRFRFSSAFVVRSDFHSARGNS